MHDLATKHKWKLQSLLQECPSTWDAEVGIASNVAHRRAKEEAERKERQERQMKAEASRAKKKLDELKKKVNLPMLACIHC